MSVLLWATTISMVGFIVFLCVGDTGFCHDHHARDGSGILESNAHDLVGPEMLPPPPSMRVPNLITFSDPGERTTILTPQGPISRVVWRWTFKPATSLPADLETVIIPWFDTTTRENREVILGPRRVALAGGTGSRQKPGSSLLRFAHYAMLAGLALGLLAGLTLVMPGLKLKSRKTIGTTIRRLVPNKHIWALHFATWQNDARKVRWLMSRIILDDRRTGQDLSLDRNLRTQISMIDASLYGYSGAVIPPLGLRCFVRKFLAARRCECSDLVTVGDSSRRKRGATS